MTTSPKNAVTAIVKFLLRPFTVMWPFFVSLLFLYVAVKLLLQGYIITFKDSLPELYVISLLLSLLNGKTRTIVTGAVLLIIALLTTVEVFLMNHFKLNFMGDVIRLMMESNTSETSQFLDVFVMRWGTLKYIAVLFVSVILYFVLNRYKELPCKEWRGKGIVACALLMGIAAQFYYSGWIGAQRYFVSALMSKNVYDIELRYIYGEEHGGCGLKTSLSRLIFGIRLYYLTTLQCDEIIETSKTVSIDTCDHTSPNIMLFIGESFIKRHASIYGYTKSTTPIMQGEVDKGNMVVVDDAMTIATQTSEVFKNMLSLHSIDQPNLWTSSPMLMHLMKLAHYRVSFITNQFASQDHSIWISTGGFFLNNPRLTNVFMDYQTIHRYKYDESLLTELDKAIKQDTYNFNIFHVRGQHVSFEKGYPQGRAHFTVADYADRTELSLEQKQEVAHYDNCTLYQDSICGQLFDKYRDKDMVIVFVSDHGENVYDDGYTLGRVHNDFSRPMIESQYEVPMWIWYSPKYAQLHPEMVEKIHNAAHRPFQIDDISHLIIELAGVKCKYFDPSRSLINDCFNVARKRIH